MNNPRIDWNALSPKHAPELVRIAQDLFSEGGPFEVSAETMAAQTSRTSTEAKSLLIDLSPPLLKMSVKTCPNCQTELTADDVQMESCPHCRERYAEHNGIQTGEKFAYHAARTRDVTWVLALHGMNTRGAWQEEFNWRVATAYGRSVPVSIYKYGLARPGAAWRPSLRSNVKRLIARISKLQGDADNNGFNGPPDVIAHSLGTWLIGHALQWCPSLKIGRLITVGSILRPDFDWASVINRGQVEAVLNHYGTKDFWAGITHFVIPDSGPSGRRGFNSEAPIKQVSQENYGHSDYFLEKNLATSFEKIWRPFLTNQNNSAERIEIFAESSPTEWQPSSWIFQATILPPILLAVYWVCLGTIICLTLLGAYQVFR